MFICLSTVPQLNECLNVNSDEKEVSFFLVSREPSTRPSMWRSVESNQDREEEKDTKCRLR